MAGDTHVYKNHVELVKEQLGRHPSPFPLLHIIRRVTNINDFVASDFQLQHYTFHPAIHMKMAV